MTWGSDMPRKLRWEQVGGLYHVINRGNYRLPVFANVGAAEAFEHTLWEALGKYGWRLHGYVLMSNHYHLALETPQPNLADGMHWLQSTYATRFNRFRAERGHLFQGRYQALCIEEDGALRRVVDYIHLNPVRAGIIEVAALANYRRSSLHRFLSGARPPGLTPDRFLRNCGFTDDKEGWSAYMERLGLLGLDEAEQKRLGWADFSKGWAIGTSGWKRALAKEFAQKSLVGLARDEAQAIREAGWQTVLETALLDVGRTLADLTPVLPRARGHSWRLPLAARLREAGAPYPWIAAALGFHDPLSLKVKLFRFHNSNVSM